MAEVEAFVGDAASVRERRRLRQTCAMRLSLAQRDGFSICSIACGKKNPEGVSEISPGQSGDSRAAPGLRTKKTPSLEGAEQAFCASSRGSPSPTIRCRALSGLGAFEDTGNPGRRSAADAVSLCPGLICCAPFGAIPTDVPRRHSRSREQILHEAAHRRAIVTGRATHDCFHPNSMKPVAFVRNVGG
jgi:hypothetical protein